MGIPPQWLQKYLLKKKITAEKAAIIVEDTEERATKLSKWMCYGADVMIDFFSLSRLFFES